MSTVLGKSIYLRSVEVEDLARLVEWRNKPSISTWFFNDKPILLEGQHDWLRALKKDTKQQLFIICLTENRQPIGMIGLCQINDSNRSAEFGNLLIGETVFLGRGLAREATELLLGVCFRQLELNRVCLKTFADNARAISLYQKCGFAAEGILRRARFKNGVFRDVTVMGILREEFLTKRHPCST